MVPHRNLPKYEFYAILESFDYTAVVMKNQRLGRTLPKSSSTTTREEMRAIRIGGERNRKYRLADDAKRLHFILLHIGRQEERQEGSLMIKRMLLSSLSLVFLILALFLIFGREEEVVGCFPTAELEAASLAALRAEVSIAKELQAAPCAEADSSRKQLYEEIQLARLERILVPLSDFGGRELSKILVDEQEVCYIYSDASRSVILVRVSRPDACAAESVYQRYAAEYGGEIETSQYLYNRERGDILSIIDGCCVQICVRKDDACNSFSDLKNYFHFETVYFS